MWLKKFDGKNKNDQIIHPIFPLIMLNLFLFFSVCMPVVSITQIDSLADDRSYLSIYKVMTRKSDRLRLCVVPSCTSLLKNGAR